ncbi:MULTISPECIES: PqqD family protein [Bacillus cereus group]|uniref:PqqD family protein n=1 Tax=Bacillus cereus group TaxID=86661 RepID=UPI000945831F|nr:MULTISPECIES: PqqD family protein [Bacillus cereus group]MCU5324827.1 PqqD family protein [Bacillus cereus]KAA0787866.1 PqqD family protein [Bacillus sp. BB081]MCU5374145.1 PqqD family protein [Bacillus pacificus]MCU5473296.1 PqqD family protein [Bacillus paranthracis]MCX9099791.1 PqqD family protein [Bacillus anthracis]
MYNPSPQVKVTTLYDDIILLNTNTGEYLSFNETGRLFWQVLVNTKNEDEALQILLKQVDAPFDTLKESLHRFKDKLLQAGLIEGK